MRRRGHTESIGGKTRVPLLGQQRQEGWLHSARLKSRGTHGMTLVEVVVATVILGVGVAGLMSAASRGMRNQQKSEMRAAALQMAQQKLSEVDLIGAHVWMLARPMSGEEALGAQTYRWTLKIEQQSVGELFAVHVKVEWAGPGAGSVELDTWLNDYEAKATQGGETDTATGKGGNARK